MGDSTRAGKSGLALDAFNKNMSKYDPAQMGEIMQWIKSFVSEPDFSTDGSMDSVHETLADGYILRLFLEELRKRACPAACQKKAIKKEKMAFKKMEEINQFLSGISKDPFKVDNFELFQTVDLYEKQNMASVMTCLSALGRKCGGLGLPGIGPKEAQANKRDFTEEQLKAGANVIGLQMGSNKGASQAGQNFGKGRGINDI